ncbi:MAG: hypothetical protein K0R09_3009 [Clostridiales bacterium]|nr:hypothetical protein [Clostridiales bacterium]
MKDFIKKIWLMLLTITLISTTITFRTMAVGNQINNMDSKYLSDNKFQVITENNLMTLYANEVSGEFAVEDKRNGFIWYSNPKNRDDDKVAQGVVKMDLSSQLNVVYTDYSSEQMKIKNNFTGSTKKNGVKFEKINKGFRVTYSFPGEDDFTIPLNITLEENYVSAEIDIANITEKNNTIYSLDLLPYFGSGSSSDNGYIFIPDGSGALINFNNNKSNVETYKEAIYGRDATFSSNQNPVKREDIKLPVFGIKNGKNAFLAVVDKGDSQGSISANVSGIKSSYNNVFGSFDIRKFDSFIVGISGGSSKTTRLYEKGKSQIDGCKINYYLLQGKEADYVGMAKIYREYLKKEKGLTANKDIKPQMYLSLYGAVRKQKSILGIPFNTIQPLTTYKDTVNILQSLKQSKVSDIVVNYYDWNSDSIDCKIATSAAAIGKLGGLNGLKELISYTKDNNVKLFPQVDFLKFLNGKFGFFKMSNQSKTLGTVPSTVFEYSLSTYFQDKSKLKYNLQAPSKLDEIIKNFNKSYKDYKIGGIGLDTISSLVYSDFTKSQMSIRQETEKKWIDSLKVMKNDIGSVAASGPNAYSLPYIDYILDVPSDSSHYYIQDETIPFYEIVIRGIKPYTIEAFNFSADKDVQLLKAIETGANPYYIWTGEDTSVLKETKYEGLYSSDYKSWVSSAISDFETFKNLYVMIQDSTIDKHEKLTEGVFRVTYSNGTGVVVNYSENEYWIGNTIIPPTQYVILEGGNK